jgi:hypothetical protein
MTTTNSSTPIFSCANCTQDVKWTTAVTNDGSYLSKVRSTEPHTCKIKASTTTLLTPFTCGNTACAGEVQWNKGSQVSVLHATFQGVVEPDIHNCQFFREGLRAMSGWELSQLSNN